MGRWLAGRIAQAFVVVALVTTASFALVHLAPGDPFSLDVVSVPAPVRAAQREQFGLDRPLAEQYLRWVGNAARGDLGWSFSRRMPVREALADAIPRTLLLTGVALALSFARGVALGVWQAVRRDSVAARATSTLSLVLYSMPDFWLALLLLLTFSYWIPILPAGGVTDPFMYDYMSGWGKLVDRLKHLVLPAGTLALLTTAAVARFQRAALLEVVELDYVRTARAKGLGERAVLVRHALRNALVPVVTLVGLALPGLLGGAVFVEKVFAWPGMGQLTVNAIASRDYPLVTAGVVVGGTMVAVGSLVADLLLVAIDPRVRAR